MDSNDSAQRNQIKSLSNIFKNTPIIVPNHFYKNVDISNKIKQAKNTQTTPFKTQYHHLPTLITRTSARILITMPPPPFLFSPSLLTNCSITRKISANGFSTIMFTIPLSFTRSPLHPTQSGKTGSMLSIIFNAISHPTHAVPIHNIYIFTPHSSREWLLQTRERFPPLLHQYISPQ